jgi:hypothetical protein
MNVIHWEIWVVWEKKDLHFEEMQKWKKKLCDVSVSAKKKPYAVYSQYCRNTAIR